MLWAVFKDARGVAYCEPVNEGLCVSTLGIRAREEKRHWLTRKIIQPRRAAQQLIHVRFSASHYSKKDYVASAFEEAPEGYVFRDDIRYMQENRWGPVNVILFIKNDKLGRRAQYEFRKITPEGNLYDLSQRDPKGTPHPLTDRIIEMLIEKTK